MKPEEVMARDLGFWEGVRRGRRRRGRRRRRVPSEGYRRRAVMERKLRFYERLFLGTLHHPGREVSLLDVFGSNWLRENKPVGKM